MKKLTAALLVFLMMVMTGAMALAYTEGTYTATAQGNNGPVTVSVTFSADAITDVTVVEHSETAGLSDRPIAEIPAAIVENQSLAVDTVSGRDQLLQRHPDRRCGLRGAGGRRRGSAQGRRGGEGAR